MTTINSILRSEKFTLANDIVNDERVGKNLSKSEQQQIAKAAQHIARIACPKSERKQLDNAINKLWTVLYKQRTQKKKYFKIVTEIQSQVTKETKRLKKIAKQEKTKAISKKTLPSNNSVAMAPISQSPLLPSKNVMVVSTMAVNHHNPDSLFSSKKYDQVVFPDKKWKELLSCILVQSNPDITTLKISPLYELESDNFHTNSVNLNVVTSYKNNIEKSAKTIQTTTEIWKKIIKYSNVKAAEIGAIGEIGLFLIEDVN